MIENVTMLESFEKDISLWYVDTIFVTVDDHIYINILSNLFIYFSSSFFFYRSLKW